MEAMDLLFLGAIRRPTYVALLSAATTTAPLCRGVNDDGLRHLLNSILRSLRMRRFFSSLKSLKLSGLPPRRFVLFRPVPLLTSR